MKKDRITREKEMLPEMVKIYCYGMHKSKKGTLCKDCQELTDYALFRLDHCRWGNDKNFCSQCPCHCYKPDMRSKIKEVMRYSGPRIMLYHPLVGTIHGIETIKGVIKAKKKSK
ncbi:nitrous oxide-stimulated promoter family protein [Eubacterium sp.]|uniref:nitrous oxide-stimulated promoter family protein n=1 Tax=Eubacterium sp. TaxID=142586 RepID=UPI0025C42B00|nr:nitrous oxide-stimulated promoter family protein [Eubacterium sp.]